MGIQLISVYKLNHRLQIFSVYKLNWFTYKPGLKTKSKKILTPSHHLLRTASPALPPPLHDLYLWNPVSKNLTLSRYSLAAISMVFITAISITTKLRLRLTSSSFKLLCLVHLLIPLPSPLLSVSWCSSSSAYPWNPDFKSHSKVRLFLQWEKRNLINSIPSYLIADKPRWRIGKKINALW